MNKQKMEKSLDTLRVIRELVGHKASIDKAIIECGSLNDDGGLDSVMEELRGQSTIVGDSISELCDYHMILVKEALDES